MIVFFSFCYVSTLVNSLHAKFASNKPFLLFNSTIFILDCCTSLIENSLWVVSFSTFSSMFFYYYSNSCLYVWFNNWLFCFHQSLCQCILFPFATIWFVFSHYTSNFQLWKLSLLIDPPQSSIHHQHQCSPLLIFLFYLLWQHHFFLNQDGVGFLLLVVVKTSTHPTI